MLVQASERLDALVSAEAEMQVAADGILARLKKNGRPAGLKKNADADAAAPKITTADLSSALVTSAQVSPMTRSAPAPPSTYPASNLVAMPGEVAAEPETSTIVTRITGVQTPWDR